MTWGQFTTFLWGSAVVIVDALIGPIYRRITTHR